MAGKINNIEADRGNRDCVEGPAITAVGREGRRGTLSHSHVDYATNVDLQNGEKNNGESLKAE